MLKLNPKWQETAESLLQKSLREPNARLRERLLALHFVASGEPADRVARKIGRSRYALYDWIHNFNAKGIAGIVPNWKGNPGKLLSDNQLDALKQAVKQHPRELGIKKGRWTAMTVAAYVQNSFGIKISHDTARDYLRLLGFSYKKPAKKLIKADAEKQKQFAKELEQLEDQRCGKSITVYYDEGKIEQDALPRKGWFLKDQPAQIESSSPGKKRSSSMRPSSGPREK
jgi:transposase